MIRASDLLGCVVHTESGKKVGRVHDLRAKTTESDCLLIGLMVGRGGMLSRLAGGGAGAGPTRGDDVVPWEAITHLEDGQIIIRD
jgi:sporulation protein YlmC with PRC-barrel domain